MSQRNAGIVGGNAFKMALFGSNCSGGVAFVNVPERWDGSWENNLKLTQLSEKVGIECIIPVARELARVHAAGFDGAAIDFVNYLDELPYFAQEVIPRLERMGIRKPV
jgi:FMNH2-dependent dimethyl sulfone monooxygenase